MTSINLGVLTYRGRCVDLGVPKYRGICADLGVHIYHLAAGTRVLVGRTNLPIQAPDVVRLFVAFASLLSNLHILYTGRVLEQARKSQIQI